MEEVPLLKDLHTRYAQQAEIIGVSIDVSVPRVDRTIREKGMTWPILADGNGFDGQIPRAYHIQGTPDLFIVDRNGKILARLGSAKQIEERLKEALR
jgi:peroxiredoxin